MVGLFVLVFALYLAAALLAKKPPGEGERHASMVALLVLIPTLLSQRLPPTILPLLSLFSRRTCTGRGRVMADVTVRMGESGTLGEL